MFMCSVEYLYEFYREGRVWMNNALHIVRRQIIINK